VITLEWIYILMGVLAAGVAIVNLRDPSNPKRYNNALFWGLYAVTFLVGSRLPHFASGCVVIAMVLVASIGKLGHGTAETSTQQERDASARRFGNRLFIPALTIPVVTLAGTFLFKGTPYVDPKQVTLISLGVATVVALVIALVMLRNDGGADSSTALGMTRTPLGLTASITEARRLWDSVGWAAILPQMLAALGALFATAGVGRVVATIAEKYLPLGSPFAAVVTYTVGMALFTMIMGNAFAAFPVMTAGIGLPLIYTRYGGDVTVMAAVGMLSGFCGTLMTPMAANFNIVPAALLELPDEYAVIKAQVPTGILMLVANTAIMYFLVYRH
jgi:uncharacterized membrane protein